MMPHCATCGVFLRVGPTPRNTRGMQIHVAAPLHWAAERGHRLIELYRPGYGFRWRCGCGERDKEWRPTKAASFRRWIRHVGHTKPESAAVPRALPATDGRMRIG